MFNRKLISKLESEITYLRKLVDDLHDRLMAFNESAFYKYQTKDLLKKTIPQPRSMNFMGEIESMEAKTDEEKVQKAEAIKEIREILG